MAYVYYNPNRLGKDVGDCVIRGLCKVLGINDWRTVYLKVCIKGYMLYDMPSSNSVWEQVLFDYGFKSAVLPNTCPRCYTLRQFCKDYPIGRYLVATGTHVIAVVDGDYYDTGDSGNEVVTYFYYKEEN